MSAVLFFGGTIRIDRTHDSTGELLAVDGVIAAPGTPVPPEAERVDLQGGLLLPAFGDGHVHPLLAALVVDLNTVASVISFGALAAFSLVNLSVIKQLVIDQRLRGAGSVVRYGVLPGLGFVLTAWLWFSLAPFALIVGLIWIAAGVVYLAVMTRGFRRPPEVDFDEHGEESGRLSGNDDLQFPVASP